MLLPSPDSFVHFPEDRKQLYRLLEEPHLGPPVIVTALPGLTPAVEEDLQALCGHPRRPSLLYLLPREKLSAFKPFLRPAYDFYVDINCPRCQQAMLKKERK